MGLEEILETKAIKEFRAILVQQAQLGYKVILGQREKQDLREI
jgi:hypothetical protein